LAHEGYKKEKLAIGQLKICPKQPIRSGVQDIDEFIQREGDSASIHED
jgi:hypothetical protein